MKTYLNQSVYAATLRRLREVFNRFDGVMVSFSGGKDSGVLTQLALRVAREMGRTPLHVLFYDWEAIYKETAAFVGRILSSDDVDPLWVCTPVTERNGSSLYEPFWMPWQKSKRELWVRNIPNLPCVIHEDNMPPGWDEWYDKETHDQYFFIKYADWYVKKTGCKRLANLIGIRTDESHDRYIMLKTKQNRVKLEVDGKEVDWCFRYKANAEEVWYTMPLYDWRVEDVWACIGKENLDYNRIYDKFYRMGVPLHSQRICNPYGEQQKRGLNQYHECEPESWFKIVQRVSGANFGANYNKTKLTSGSIEKPDEMTWKQYLYLLLDGLPEGTRDHYRHIVARTIWWHRKRTRETGFPCLYDDRDQFPAEPPENVNKKNDFVSYRLMCETIIKGDFWGKKLYFAETKKERKRQAELIEKYRNI
jgi:predicted phosphoadenosine phosphosulfate sulfurtransferase